MILLETQLSGDVGSSFDDESDVSSVISDV